jgi:hypothetical protein
MRLPEGRTRRTTADYALLLSGGDGQTDELRKKLLHAEAGRLAANELKLTFDGSAIFIPAAMRIMFCQQNSLLKD